MRNDSIENKKSKLVFTFPEILLPCRRSGVRCASRISVQVSTSLKRNELNSWNWKHEIHAERTSWVRAPSESEWSNPITNDFIRLLLFLLNSDYIVHDALASPRQTVWTTAVGNGFSIRLLGTPIHPKWKQFYSCACSREKRVSRNNVLFRLRFLPFQRRTNNNKHWAMRMAQEQRQMCIHDVSR